MEAWRKELYLAHAAKGTTWAKHKYIRKEGDRYIYPEDLKYDSEYRLQEARDRHEEAVRKSHERFQVERVKSQERKNETEQRYEDAVRRHEEADQRSKESAQTARAMSKARKLQAEKEYESKKDTMTNDPRFAIDPKLLEAQKRHEDANRRAKESLQAARAGSKARKIEAEKEALRKDTLTNDPRFSRQGNGMANDPRYAIDPKLAEARKRHEEANQRSKENAQAARAGSKARKTEAEKEALRQAEIEKRKEEIKQQQMERAKLKAIGELNTRNNPNAAMKNDPKYKNIIKSNHNLEARPLTKDDYVDYQPGDVWDKDMPGYVWRMENGAYKLVKLKRKDKEDYRKDNTKKESFNKLLNASMALTTGNPMYLLDKKRLRR